MTRRFLSLVLALMLVVTLVPLASAEDTEPVFEEATLRLVLNVPAEVDLENNPIIQRVYERTGIKMEIEAPPQNSYWERTRVIVASGDYPDIMLQGTDVDMEKWAEEGILAELDNKIVNYPNLMKNISAQQWSDTRAMSTGKIVGVPRPNTYSRWGYIINETWLENLNLEAPKTVEEFIEVCRAFTFDDPDGNGKDDTTGVTFYNEGDNKVISLYHDFLSTAFRISQHTGLPERDGTFSIVPKQTKEYLDVLRSMYAEGILDREFLTQNSQQQICEKFAQGRVGIIGFDGKSFISSLTTQYGIPADTYSYHAPLVLQEDEAPIYMMPPSNWCAFLVFADGDVDTSLRLLDFMNSEEGFLLFNLGIEGEHYNSYDIENRVVDETEEQVEARSKVTAGWFSFTSAYLQRPLVEIDGNTEAEKEKWLEEFYAADSVTDKYYVPFVKTLYSFSSEYPDETKTWAMLQSRYVSGESEWAELEDFLVNDYAPKYAQYEQLYNEYMAESPIEIVR